MNQVSEAESYLPTPRRHWATLSIATGLLVTVLDASMVVVMLPLIADAYSVEPSLAIWVMTSYQLTMACLLLQAAAFSERFGHWKIFCGGLGLFAVAALCCAFSGSLATLIFFRVLQGIGAAAVHSISLALTRHSYPRALFGRASGINSSVVGLSMAAGPSVGALVLMVTDWRGVFFVGAPLAVFSLVVGLAALPRLARSKIRLDFISGGMLAVAMTCLLLTLGEMRDGINLPLLTTGFAASTVLFAVLVRRQRGMENPLVPIDLLAIKAIAFSLGGNFCTFAAQALTLVSLPFHLRTIMDISPAMVGLLITPWPAGVAVMAVFAGRLSDSYSPRLLCTAGSALLMAGVTALFMLPENAGVWDVSWRMLLCGIGFGLFNTPNNRVAILSTPLSRTTASGALLATCRLTGQAFGAAVASLAFSHWQSAGGTAALGCAMALASCAILLSALRQAR